MSEAADIDFLANSKPFAEETAVWVNGTVHLQIASYLTSELPPRHLVTSARCIFFQGNKVMVITEPDGKKHPVPGGRCEDGESVAETARREVLEETGWTLDSLHQIGVIHFQHLTPKPPNHPYAYPHFLQVVYAANALVYQPNDMIYDEYVVSSDFVALTAVSRLSFSTAHLGLIKAACDKLEKPFPH